MKIASTINERQMILDHVAGWRELRREHLSLTRPEGYLSLDSLPGRGRLLVDEGVQKNELVCPSALAIGRCGELLIADAATNRLYQIDLSTKRINALPAIDQKGAAPRQLNQPRGVASLPSGAIVVSDTGNNRVQVFSPPPYALLQIWDDAMPLHSPWAIAADGCGVVYVADRGNHRVRRIAHDGTPLADVGEGILREPTRLALGPGNVLAVIDPLLESAIVFSPGNSGAWTFRFNQNEGPRCVAFDSDGMLFVGDAIGLIHVFEPDSAGFPGTYRLVGTGDTGISGEMVDLVWTASRDRALVAIIHERPDADTDGGHRRLLWKCAPNGAFVRTGCFITTALDSGIERCQWHRVLLKATVPLHTSLQIDSFTSDNLADGELPWLNMCKAPGPGDDSEGLWKTCLLSGDDNPDCLVQSGTGQYLWLRLTFVSNDLASPVIRSIKVSFPRANYLQYLPAVYQEDEESRLFLERFLSIFQTEFDKFDQRIDRLWQLFDPDSIPERHFPWLASWFALLIPPDPEWSWEKKRQMLRTAFRDYRERGTVAGLQKAVEDYAGVTAKVLEHFRLRRWPALALAAPLDGTTPLWSRHFYQRLQETSYSQLGYFRLTGRPEPALEPFDWGAHKFTIFFPAHPYRVEETKQNVARVVEREKPTHTQATLCPVLPRFRVGVQATVGVDSVVGGISQLVLGQLSTLGYDTILACSPYEQQIRALGAVLRPRVGVSTTLS